MSQPRPAVDDVATAEDRPETTFADEATATGRSEAEYQYPATIDEKDDRTRLRERSLTGRPAAFRGRFL